MLCWLYEIGPFHLNTAAPWKLMNSMACFVQITAKLNDTVFYHYGDVVFSKRNYVNICIFHNMFKRDL